ncbi:junctional adhesion molecule B isoform 1-T1 [Amazona ochrocephala]
MTGTVVQLSCKETEGSPPSEYQWYKNGVALLEKTGTGNARAANVTYTMNKKSGTLLFNTVTKNDTGEYFCEASNGIGLSQKCSVKRMQVDDLNVSGIITAVVFVALIMASCGLGVFYAQKKGYFTKESSSQKKTNYQSTSEKACILCLVCLNFRCHQNLLICDGFAHMPLPLTNCTHHQYMKTPSVCIYSFLFFNLSLSYLLLLFFFFQMFWIIFQLSDKLKSNKHPYTIWQYHLKAAHLMMLFLVKTSTLPCFCLFS